MYSQVTARGRCTLELLMCILNLAAWLTSQLQYFSNTFSTCESVSCSVMSNSLQPHGWEPTRLLCPWGFSRQEYWNRLPFLLQGILLTQGSNSGLPHCRQILYFLSHQGSPTFSTYYMKMMILPQQLPCSYILAILMPPASFSLFYFTIQGLQ